MKYILVRTLVVFLTVVGFLAPISFATQTPNALYFIGFNSQLITPLNDLRVRRAIAYAVDKRNIVAMVSGAVQATGIQPPAGTFFFARPNEPYPYDLNRARELLKAAGVEKLSLDLYAGQTRKAVAESIAQNLAVAGVQVNARLVANNDEMIRAIKGNKAHLFILGSGINPSASEERLRILLWDFYSKSDNYSLYHYRNQTADELLVKAENDANPNTKSELYREVEDLLLADIPVIPLFWIFVSL